MNLIELKERIAVGESLSPDDRDFVLAAINAYVPPQPGVTAYLDPGNYMGRIDSLWAYLSLDDGGEGVCAAPMGELPVVPLIAADKTRLLALRPLAVHIAKTFGKPVRLAKFTKREDVEVIAPS